MDVSLMVLQVFPRGVGVEFLKLKNDGNAHAKKRNLDEAIDCYTRCLKLSLPYFGHEAVVERFYKNHPIATVLSNRSQMYFMKEEYYKSFLDCISVLECLHSRNKSSEIKFVFPSFSILIILKARLRMSRILSFLGRNYPSAYRYLDRSIPLVGNEEFMNRDKDGGWKMKIFNEAVKIGDEFHKRLHNFQNQEEEGRQDFHKFCVNAKSLRFLPVKIERRASEKLEDRQFMSYSIRGRYIYVFGGREGNPFRDRIVYFNDLIVFDIRESKVQQINYQSGNIPTKRCQHKTVIYGNYMYLFGGDNVMEKPPIHSFYRLNLETFKWEKLPMPLKGENILKKKLCLFDHSMIVVDSEMFIYGGCSRFQHLDASAFVDNGTLYSYNFLSKKWRIVSKFSFESVTNSIQPPPRSNHAMWEMKNGKEIYIFGGQIIKDSELYKYYNKEVEEEDEEKLNYSSYILGDLWCFDTEEKKWNWVIQIGSIPSRRTEIQVTKINEKVYLFGGFLNEAIMAMNSEVVNETGGIIGIDRFVYYSDLHVFSLYNREGNEFFGESGVFKHRKTGYWRKILYPRQEEKYFYERSFVFPFRLGKCKLGIWGGYLGGRRNKLKMFWDEVVEISLFKKEGCVYCLKKCKKMKKCGRCNHTSYCGRECQKKDWQRHKKVCGKTD